MIFSFQTPFFHSVLFNGVADIDADVAKTQDSAVFIDVNRLDDSVDIRIWIRSGDTYTIRFGVGMLMEHFLDEDFDPRYPEMVAKLRSSEYYVNMMIAWYFATALAKQYDAVLPYIEERKLDVWTHNKTIQKAVESYRITEEQKTYLRTLRVKK